MGTRLSADEVRAWRARSQGLAAGPRDGAVADAVRGAAALQAQDVKAFRLQVRARGAGPLAGDVDGACGGERREVVRTWLMRGTLHAVPAEDVRWMNALLGPRYTAAARGRRAQLGLDGATLARALPALETVLAGRPPMPRDELVARLGEHGVRLDPRSQAPAHLLLYAAGAGLVCRGPEAAGDTSTYVLREEWLAGVEGPDLDGDDALAELAVRHARAYGPVTEADLARWSGLPLGQARRGVTAAGSRLTTVAGPGGPMLVAAGTAPPPPAGPFVRLTGHFDPYLLGYRDRDLLLPPAAAPRIATGGGLLMPCVLADGLVVGTWRHAWHGGCLELRVEAFGDAPDDAVREGIAAEVADIGRFLGAQTRWRLVDRI
ncbi:winged helix DNA-binding domain-containing protein [Streptomyces sp. NPDC001070]